MLPNICYDTFITSWGWVAVMTSERGLLGISLPQVSEEKALTLLSIDPDNVLRASRCLQPIRTTIRSYFRGEPIKNEIELDFTDAPSFFRAAWIACKGIPFGETRSYGWIAAKAGNPCAVRAAGQAMARNPLPFIVPCHRVIRSNGFLGDYAGGSAMKAKLLQMESTPK